MSSRLRCVRRRTFASAADGALVPQPTAFRWKRRGERLCLGEPHQALDIRRQTIRFWSRLARALSPQIGAEASHIVPTEVSLPQQLRCRGRLLLQDGRSRVPILGRYLGSATMYDGFVWKNQTFTRYDAPGGYARSHHQAEGQPNAADRELSQLSGGLWKDGGMSGRSFPFSPRSTRQLELGDLIAVPCEPSGSGCLQVVDLRRRGPGSLTTFVAGVLPWRGDHPPTGPDVVDLVLSVASFDDGVDAVCEDVLS
jgi:hypothetical protein